MSDAVMELHCGHHHMCIHAKHDILARDVHERTTGQQISSIACVAGLAAGHPSSLLMQIFRQVASMNSSHIVQVCSV
jgi:hypothetical protein